jgi:hypothetical protein
MMNKWSVWTKVFVIALIGCGLTTFSAHAAEQETLERLEKLIRQQQARIEALQEQVDALKGRQAGPTPAPTASGTSTAVKPGSPKANVTIYGQVNKAVLYANDGHEDNTYLVDNDNSSTRMGLKAAINPNDRYTIGAKIEVEYQTNASNVVSQDNKRDDSDKLNKRHLDLWVNDGKFGKFSLGHGSTASDGTSEMDLSGTDLVGYSSVADMAGGQKFYDNGLSDTQVKNVFSNLDGLGRDERIRYDSPTLFDGVMFSTSYINNGGGDFAVRYTTRTDDLKIAAGAAYANPAGTSDIDDQLAGSVSALHASGFNGTFAMGVADNKGGRSDSDFFYFKFGYRAQWCPLGVTSLSADIGRFSDFGEDGGDANTFGLQMVQDLYEWGSEFYVGYRLHDLDSFDNINAIMTGMRVKF